MMFARSLAVLRIDGTVDGIASSLREAGFIPLINQLGNFRETSTFCNQCVGTPGLHRFGTLAGRSCPVRLHRGPIRLVPSSQPLWNALRSHFVRHHHGGQQHRRHRGIAGLFADNRFSHLDWTGIRRKHRCALVLFEWRLDRLQPQRVQRRCRRLDAHLFEQHHGSNGPDRCLWGMQRLRSVGPGRAGRQQCPGAGWVGASGGRSSRSRGSQAQALKANVAEGNRAEARSRTAVAIRGFLIATTSTATSRASAGHDAWLARCRR